LSDQLDYRGWRQTDLARVTGWSSSAVSRWANDKELPKPAACRAIAQALDQPELEVLERAGHFRLPAFPPAPSRETVPGLLRRALALMVEREQERVRLAIEDGTRGRFVALRVNDGLIEIDQEAPIAPDMLVAGYRADGAVRVYQAKAEPVDETWLVHGVVVGYYARVERPAIEGSGD
jgi:transcriptional regulator with XRE-family HTH domain